MTWDQIKGIIERIVLVGLTWAATRGYITSADVATISAAVLAVIGAAYAWWINRPKAIAQAAANIPNTTVVTTPALAAATPETSNIVSNTEVQVVNR